MLKHKSLLFSWLIVALILSACAEPTAVPTAVPPSETPDPRSGVVADFTGPVQGRRVNAEALSDVNIGFRILETGEVRTGESARARLDLSDGAIVRLASNTQSVLENAQPDEFGFVLAEMQLLLGKIWISLTGGEAQIETPLGVATVRGSFGIVAYDPAVNVMRFDCFEGTCTVTSPVFNGQINPMERVVLNQNNFLRQPIPPEEVQQFIQDNPESARLVATLTALPPLAPTFTPTLEATPTETATAVAPVAATATLVLPTATGTPTFTPLPPTLTFTPAFTILGQHTVRGGETLFCIGRGYGVLPSAIAAANGFAPSTALRTNQVLNIPAVQWTNISAGPSCLTQFRSPYPGLPPGGGITPTTPA
ncbi:MAG: FecR domain-containing protein, partial [Anaerolineales bacterium]|nr:FecR domain-containing protein [Anaerolineales bacterium]